MLLVGASDFWTASSFSASALVPNVSKENHKEYLERSAKIMKINDLRKGWVENQRLARAQFCFSRQSTKF
jgi:hypothetical protein